MFSPGHLAIIVEGRKHLKKRNFRKDLPLKRCLFKIKAKTLKKTVLEMCHKMGMYAKHLPSKDPSNAQKAYHGILGT